MNPIRARMLAEGGGRIEVKPPAQPQTPWAAEAKVRQRAVKASPVAAEQRAFLVASGWRTSPNSGPRAWIHPANGNAYSLSMAARMAKVAAGPGPLTPEDFLISIGWEQRGQRWHKMCAANGVTYSLTEAIRRECIANEIEPLGWKKAPYAGRNCWHDPNGSAYTVSQVIAFLDGAK